MPELRSELESFADAKGLKSFRGKGAISLALVVTRQAMSMGLPLDPETLVTESGGQVRGLSKDAVQGILNEHGISRVLANQGGRTSRGSLTRMRTYVSLLNSLNERGMADFHEIEAFWIERTQRFLAAKPLRIKLDSSRGLRAVIRDVVRQAVERQKEVPGVYYSGAVLQHLVGAKLECALGPERLAHNSFSTADAPSGRPGDFFVGDVAIHVTTAPGVDVVSRCLENLNEGLRPILVTIRPSLRQAEEAAENAGLGDRIDVFEVEQFVALNLYELGEFGADGRKTAVRDLIDRYNRIVEKFETDPALKIELRH